ncbi:chemotaxis protein MotC [Mesorhizobium sp. CGMCC 1.15528]|uniref:Chemotaxis protein MotC n=1 Tax=Mesorhizobium zhangyense TaxID=1776730 RepID=A0A7C9VH06_9HYPH|nr:chemotaxis protein MotC [Mesorhizobium zhangyense]NGN44228.1 chemotaxis protein MotC [Mesorhizobium zhangyense]
MRLARPLHGLIGMALLAAAALPVSARAETQLQPFQMVRSLQLVQDRIASGDHAALPMQRKLLEMIDDRLRKTGQDGFDDPRNYRAMLVYAMSGGNPATIDTILSRLVLDEQNLGIGKGLLDYLNGQAVSARTTLGPVDPMKQPPELGAFLALVKGSLAANDNPQGALKLFDQARLLGPGTLVEEAALRRSIGLATAHGDAGRFTLASTQYVERYLRSPYASQFADSFVAGVIALHDSIDLAKVSEITTMMDAEQERVIYLRIARVAGIDGFKELSAFASAKAEKNTGSDAVAGGEDPRALLYASLASVTSGTDAEIRAMLAKIDRARLSAGDRKLFDAVAAVASKMTGTLPAPTRQEVRQAIPITAAADESDPLVIEADPLPLDAVEEQQPQDIVEAPPPITLAESTPAQAAPQTPPDPADEKLVANRKKLEEIDKMLGDAQ